MRILSGSSVSIRVYPWFFRMESNGLRHHSLSEQAARDMRDGMRAIRIGIVAFLVGMLTVPPAPLQAECTGDCNINDLVEINELVGGVNCLLGISLPDECRIQCFDSNEDGLITINELIQAVNNALNGCVIEDVECNGFPELCERRYDEVSYPTAHNAMSNFEENWQAANQNFGLGRQLRDGVRALMLDTYNYAICVGGRRNGQTCPASGCGADSVCEPDLYLCHGTCLLGKEKLISGLTKIRTFLDTHHNQVVSIIFESYISGDDTAAAFAASGLLDYVHTQSVDDPWPTLAELIASGRRLVVFTDRRDDAHAWHHYVWDFAWETHFSFAKPEDLSCAGNRGNPANSLFILNHFLTRSTGEIELAEQVNHNPLFVDRALQCQTESGRLPNFVTVDFYDIGDTFSVVNVLNGIE